MIDQQRENLTHTLSLGDEILSKAHQEAVPIMRRWLAVLRQRMDDVDHWATNFEKNIQVCLLIDLVAIFLPIQIPFSMESFC